MKSQSLTSVDATLALRLIQRIEAFLEEQKSAADVAEELQFSADRPQSRDGGSLMELVNRTSPLGGVEKTQTVVSEVQRIRLVGDALWCCMETSAAIYSLAALDWRRDVETGGEVMGVASLDGESVVIASSVGVYSAKSTGAFCAFVYIMFQSCKAEHLNLMFLCLCIFFKESCCEQTRSLRFSSLD